MSGSCLGTVWAFCTCVPTDNCLIIRPWDISPVKGYLTTEPNNFSGGNSAVLRQDQYHRPSPCCLLHTETPTVWLWIPHESTVTQSHVRPSLPLSLIEADHYSYSNLNIMRQDCDHKRSSFRCVACHALSLVNDPFKHNSCFFLPVTLRYFLSRRVEKQQECMVSLSKWFQWLLMRENRQIWEGYFNNVIHYNYYLPWKCNQKPNLSIKL